MNDEITTDSWSERIESFSKIIGLDINQVEYALSEKPFELTENTAYVLEMLSDEDVTPFGDLRKIFCDSGKVSLPQLRLGVKYLRGPKEKRKEATSNVDPDLMDLKSKYGIKTDINDLGPEELIPYYNPLKTNKISVILQNMFGEKPVIAFNPQDGNVALDETLDYISDLSNGYPEESSIEVNGELVKLYPIGVMPNNKVDEDPLFPNNPLKRDRSIVNRVNWKDIPVELRQFARIAVENGEVNAKDRGDVRQLIQDLKEGLNGLSQYYPKTYLEFNERKENDELPKLKVKLGSFPKKSNDPFSIQSNRTF